MNYDVFDELFVFQKCIKCDDAGIQSVYNRYVLREPNRTTLSQFMSVFNSRDMEILTLFAENDESVKHGGCLFYSPDILVGTATIVLEEGYGTRKLVSGSIVTKKYMGAKLKNRPTRLPAIENIEEYWARWIGRMYKSFCDTLSASKPEKYIKIAVNYTKVYGNYVLKYLNPTNEIVIANLKNGKFGRAKFDGTGMFSFKEGIAIAWARLNNRVVPQMPREAVTIADLKCGDRFRPITASGVFTYVSKDPDSDNHIVKGVGDGSNTVFITDGVSINGCSLFYRLAPAKRKE